MTKRICILGAGLVARPAVNYLLAEKSIHLDLVDIDVSKAETLIGNAPNGRALQAGAGSPELTQIIHENDAVISLLPQHLHYAVAEVCLQERKHLITASYISPEMASLNQAAEDRELLFLNEAGLDPGIDHMSAMKIIHEIRARNGYVHAFRSICGGLPAPEAADNPLKYKFSWSPLGVLKALSNSASYLKNGKQINVPQQDLMKETVLDQLQDYGAIEVYPNRDSLKYIGLYGIEKARDVLRGTIRNPGWAAIVTGLKSMGYLSDLPVEPALKDYVSLSRYLAEKEMRRPLEALLGTEGPFSQTLRFLGLDSSEKLPPNCKSPMQALLNAMEQRMAYGPMERDMLILKHEFTAVYPGNITERIESVLVNYGLPGGDSAMSRTVSLPPAIAAKGLLNGDIKSRGVRIPVHRDIYLPILEELEAMNIRFQEKRTAALEQTHF